MTRPLVLTDEMREEMMHAARSAVPEEACGVIAGSVLYRLENRATDPTENFHIYAEDLARVAIPHGGYEGVWHTHPRGRTTPSPTDWAHHPPGKALIIATATEVNVYYAEEA